MLLCPSVHSPPSRRAPINKWTQDLTYHDSFVQVPSVDAIHKELRILTKINIQETNPPCLSHLTQSSNLTEDGYYLFSEPGQHETPFYSTAT